MGISHNRLVIQERRHKVWSLITRGLKGYEIARELNVDNSTISRDIKFLTAESSNYLNNLAKSTFTFHVSIIN